MLRGFLESVGIYKLYEKWLLHQTADLEKPQHIAVVLDGNRRWAQSKEIGIEEGHALGALVGERFLEWCLELDVKTVTMYAFSTENFQRSSEEVERILSIIEAQVRKLVNDGRVHENRVRVKAIGKLDLLPEGLRQILRDVEHVTSNYDRHYLNIALAYGGRAEIVDAARRIASEVRDGGLVVSAIDEKLFRDYLYTSHLPNPYPDLIIRSSGEERLSGFLLWQAAYSEFCFMDVYWPDFRKIDLLRAIRTFQQRRRRFGR